MLWSCKRFPQIKLRFILQVGIGGIMSVWAALTGESFVVRYAETDGLR